MMNTKRKFAAMGLVTLLSAAVGCENVDCPKNVEDTYDFYFNNGTHGNGSYELKTGQDVSLELKWPNGLVDIYRISSVVVKPREGYLGSDVVSFYVTGTNTMTITADHSLRIDVEDGKVIGLGGRAINDHVSGAYNPLSTNPVRAGSIFVGLLNTQERRLDWDKSTPSFVMGILRIVKQEYETCVK